MQSDHPTATSQAACRLPSWLVGTYGRAPPPPSGVSPTHRCSALSGCPSSSAGRSRSRTAGNCSSAVALRSGRTARFRPTRWKVSGLPLALLFARTPGSSVHRTPRTQASASLSAREPTSVLERPLVSAALFASRQPAKSGRTSRWCRRTTRRMARDDRVGLKSCGPACGSAAAPGSGTVSRFSMASNSARAARWELALSSPGVFPPGLAWRGFRHDRSASSSTT